MSGGQTNPSTSRLDIPDRDAIRAELDATRSVFHTLLTSVSGAEWRGRSQNPAWTNREVLVHIAGYLMLLPRLVGGARKGKGFPRPPLVVSRHLGTLITRWVARKEMPQSLARKYDAAHAAALALLDDIRDEEWQRGTTFPSGYQTVESFSAFTPVTARSMLRSSDRADRSPAPYNDFYRTHHWSLVNGVRLVLV